MTTEFAVSALAPNVPTVHQAHIDPCECIACVQEVLYPESFTKVKPVARSDLSNSDPASLSPPSTPSTGSTHSKRIWSWTSEDDDDDDVSSSDSEPDQKRAKTCGTTTKHPSLGRRLCLPRKSDKFLDFCRRPRTAFIDKTRCIVELPNKFQGLLLRPPRFGKSTLLSTLNEYHDIHGAKYFERHFGSLAALSDPHDSVPPHSQHLCLRFNLSDIEVCSDLTEITSQLTGRISFVLRMFLMKYGAELQISDPSGFLREQIDDMFMKVFELVKARGHTLFVSVDEYDSPVRRRAFAHLIFPAIHDGFASLKSIKHVLDTHFWGPLLAASDVIDKLFVTGTLLVEYPALKNLHALGIRNVPSLQVSCGFTEQEALTIADLVLDKTPDAVEFRRSCGGYVFPSHGVVREPLFHPQQTIARISEASRRPDADEDSFRLLSNILSLLPETSDVSGVVTLNALIDLLAAGAVEMDATSAAIGFDGAAVTWNALYHAGALTYDDQLGGTLRVVNNTALSLIHARVDTLFADWHDLQHTYFTAWSAYSIGDKPKSFLALLSQILCDLGRASFGRKHEPTMPGVLELAMRNAHTSLHQTKDPIILLPPNTTRFTIPGYRNDTVHVWELHTLTLLGMWQATNLNDGMPTVEALEKLHGELVQDDEESLLARPYRVWSPTLETMETRLVGSFFDPEPEYPQFLAVGGAQVLLRQPPIIPAASDSGL